MEAGAKEVQPDYSPWQRTKVKDTKPVTQKSVLPVIGKLLPSTSTTPEVGKSKKKIFSSSQKEEEPSGPSYPRPPLTRSLVQDLTNQKARRRNQAKNIKFLQILIKSKQLAIEELEQHCASLLEKNRSLAQSIKQMDSSSVTYARDLLEQYHLTEKSTVSMQKWNQRQVKMAKGDLKEAEEMVQKQLGELQGQLHELDSRLESSEEELRMLRTYKDKEFPGKLLHIAQLQRELQQLTEIQQAEKGDVETLRDIEIDKVLSKMENEKGADLESTTEKSKVKHFPVSLIQMAAFNCVMRKEIQLHKQIIKELKKEISDLLLKRLLLLEIRREMHPRYGRCSQHLTTRETCHLGSAVWDVG
ncbi:uncharacterized protein C20orf96 homolog isoform X2 [Rhinatrema bivittatum]|uniref:uncharacterized protein C20orf96 homolog isoform X2 n=1 Tax=Rhinatrema bivittatum TaxID=194408 RepID=UPI00112C9B16|nr:uncharacterized protein C20orf96 homolog isoform X2 [Rhinatrema bivittatum]